MKISFNWLKDYIELDESAEEVAALLTDTGLEVEKIEKYSNIPEALDGLVIGEVLSCTKHPNADKLSLTTVDLGLDKPKQIVCGAPNVAAGQKVIVAPVNSVLHPTSGEPFKIKKSKIRGELSEGMICAEDEIGVGTDHSGIMVLDTDLANGVPVRDYFDFYEDVIYEIGLTPNRGDATSHIGHARDLRAVLGRDVKWPTVDNIRFTRKDRGPEVVVENHEACPRYSGITLENITIKESPEWLKNKLQAIGVKSINNVVDITNFVLHETGQPLHAFDLDAIKGNKVVVKNLPENTEFVTLDEEERKLSQNDLMICNAEGGMCIAGVFGGIHSGVKDTTTRIFLESAYFSPDYIRATSLRHSLKTDAAFRYERGADPEITVYALKRAASLMCELADAQIVSDIVDIYPKKVEIEPIKVLYRHINRLIGIEIPKVKVHEILNRLDITTEEIDEDSFIAHVPAYRSDVNREADIIEEILRIYGFNEIELEENNRADYLADFPVVNTSELKKQITRYLNAQGFHEIMANSLTRPDYVQLDNSLKPEEQVSILNKLSEELGVLRQRLLFQLLEVVTYNQSHRQKNLKFFELGKTYHKKEKGYKEQNWLAMVIAGEYVNSSWNETGRSGTFFDLASQVTKIFSQISSKGVSSSLGSEEVFDYSLQYSLNNSPSAIVGKVGKQLSSKLGVKGEVFYAEINLDKLFQSYTPELVYQEVPKFPEVKRDLSLVLDRNISFNDIQEIAGKNSGHLLRRMEVFDVYQGDKIEQGKKAYAISFILQDKEKTLTDKAIDKTMKRLMSVFKDKLGAIIRE